MQLRWFFALVLSASLVSFGCKKTDDKEEPSAKKSDDDSKSKKPKKSDDDDDDEKKPKKKKKEKAESELCPMVPPSLDDDGLTCTCDETNIGGPVFGTGIYAMHSSPCAAAVHAGAIKKSGGEITLQKAKGCDGYVGSVKNGVTSHGWTKFGSSFYFPDKGDGKCAKTDACPASFKDFDSKDDDAEITCTCGATSSGSVWGSEIYTQDSSICRAAVHAGVITSDGGSVTAKAAPGCKSYAGTSANGVTSSSWGAYETSFYFPSKGDGICKAPKAVVASKYKTSDAVDVLWNGTWYPATVLAVATGEKYRIHYVGYDASWDEWVTLARMRPRVGATKPTPGATASATTSSSAAAKPASYAVGDAVNILWKGSWYPGKIIGVNGAQYRVHYDGYDASWDEWVTAARLKKK